MHWVGHFSIHFLFYHTWANCFDWYIGIPYLQGQRQHPCKFPLKMNSINCKYVGSQFREDITHHCDTEITATRRNEEINRVYVHALFCELDIIEVNWSAKRFRPWIYQFLPAAILYIKRLLLEGCSSKVSLFIRKEWLITPWCFNFLFKLNIRLNHLTLGPPWLLTVIAFGIWRVN